MLNTHKYLIGIFTIFMSTLAEADVTSKLTPLDPNWISNKLQKFQTVNQSARLLSAGITFIRDIEGYSSDTIIITIDNGIVCGTEVLSTGNINFTCGSRNEWFEVKRSADTNGQLKIFLREFIAEPKENKSKPAANPYQPKVRT